MSEVKRRDRLLLEQRIDQVRFLRACPDAAALIPRFEIEFVVLFLINEVLDYQRVVINPLHYYLPIKNLLGGSQLTAHFQALRLLPWTLAAAVAARWTDGGTRRGVFPVNSGVSQVPFQQESTGKRYHVYQRRSSCPTLPISLSSFNLRTSIKCRNSATIWRLVALHAVLKRRWTETGTKVSNGTCSNSIICD